MARATTGPVGAIMTVVNPRTGSVTRAAGAHHAEQRVAPRSPVSPCGAPSGSHQFRASSSTLTVTPEPATAGRQAQIANSQSPAVLATVTGSDRPAGATGSTL